jgi:butyryl-CoA dehydrogenase
MTQPATMLNLFASEALERAAYRTVHNYGGLGFVRHGVVEGKHREARMMRIVEGTRKIQRMLSVRGVLEGSRAS